MKKGSRVFAVTPSGVAVNVPVGRFFKVTPSGRTAETAVSAAELAYRATKA